MHSVTFQKLLPSLFYIRVSRGQKSHEYSRFVAVAEWVQMHPWAVSTVSHTGHMNLLGKHLRQTFNCKCFAHLANERIRIFYFEEAKLSSLCRSIDSCRNIPLPCMTMVEAHCWSLLNIHMTFDLQNLQERHERGSRTDYSWEAILASNWGNKYI